MADDTNERPLQDHSDRRVTAGGSCSMNWSSHQDKADR